MYSSPKMLVVGIAFMLRLFVCMVRERGKGPMVPLLSVLDFFFEGTKKF